MVSCGVVGRTKIKFCGIRSVEDARAAAAAGADAIGVILHADAKRRVDPELARTIVDATPGVWHVGVVADAPLHVMRRLIEQTGVDALQLHGTESPMDVAAVAPVPVTKAMVPGELQRWRGSLASNVIAVLLDGATGGSGRENDWDAVERAIIEHEPEVPIHLAGGLTPYTVAAIVKRFRPAGVDVSSGIEETFGTKSARRMAEFVAAVRAADATAGGAADTSGRTGDAEKTY
jgi:phosphoribosylanthranilate isomerase